MRSLLSFVRPMSIVAVAALAFACGAEPGDEKADEKDPVEETPAEIEIAGVWAGDWDGPTTVSSSKWGATAVIKYDNVANSAIVQLPADDEWNPSKFEKRVWTEIENDSLWYCTIALGQETAADAEATTNVADASNPEESGCGDFSWTQYTPTIELAGVWDGEWDGPTTISASKWGSSSIVKYDNTANWAIVQGAADAEWGANEFTKRVWTDIEDGSFWHCDIEFGKATAAEAEATTNVADASNPAESGCGDFSWTQYTPAASDL